MRVAPLLGYSISCYLLNAVLQHHYFYACRSSLLSLFIADGSTYCQFIDHALKALQWSPLIVAGPLLLNTQHAGRPREEEE